MHHRWAHVCAGLALAAITGLGLIGCGSDGEEGGAGGAAGGEILKVGLVSEIAGFNDRSFNHLALRGLKQAEAELGVEGRAVASGTVADYVPNLTALARQGHQLVIAVGFQMANAVDTVARSFPDTSFAIVDVSQTSLEHTPPNVLGLVFRQEQAGFLAGFLAASYARDTDGAGATLGTIGGQPVPPVKSWIGGFEAGVRRADPKAKLLSGYSQTFADQAPCKQLAQNQIAAGAKVIFQVAGGCGLGAVDAAEEAGVFVIGTDADQAYLGPQILTSALKKVDVAVLETIQAVEDGSFEPGGDRVFEVDDGALGLGKVSKEVPRELVKEAEALRDAIAAGEVTVPGADG